MVTLHLFEVKIVGYLNCNNTVITKLIHNYLINVNIQHWIANMYYNWHILYSLLQYANDGHVHPSRHVGDLKNGAGTRRVHVGCFWK